VTPGVNFTNILQAAFSYKSVLCSFYMLTIWNYFLGIKKLTNKPDHKNVDEIDA